MSGASALKRQYLGKKLFELSGLVPIGAFLVEHLYSNFQVVGRNGAARFDKVVVDLQTNPIIVYIEILGIGLPILFHAAYGLFVATRARANNGAYGYWRNWMFLLQRISGVLLLGYIGYHVYNTRLAPLLHPENPLFTTVEGHRLVTTAYMRAYLNETAIVWIYVVGLGAAVFHFSNGLWNAGVHWGLTISPRAQRISGMICGLVGLTLLVVGLASLLAFTKGVA